MGQTEFSGIDYADGGTAAAIHTVSLGLARDVDKFCGVFATTGARDTAKTNYLAVSGRVANDFLGARAYVTDRAAWCFWRGDKWVWESSHDMMADEHWSGPGGINNLATATLLSKTFTLPGSGLRRLHVTAHGNLTGTNNPGGGRIQVVGTGITSGEGYLQSWVDWISGGSGDKYRQTVVGSWYVSATGAQTYTLVGTVEGSTAFIYVSDMTLQIIDLGPSD